MWIFTWAPSYTFALYLILLHLYALQMCTQGNARSYLLENSDSTANRDPETIGYRQEDNECYITVQEIKRIGGQCVKIRDNFQGCVAGNLMDPFHQDCL